MAVDNFISFIGQNAIKLQLAEKMQVAFQSGDPIPHLLLCGPPEIGKVTLAHSIAGQMGVGAHHVSTGVKTKLDLVGVLSNVESNEVVIVEEPGYLRDEILNMLMDVVSDQRMEIQIGVGAGLRSVVMDVKPCTFVVTTSKPWQFPVSFRRWFVAMDFESYDRGDVARVFSLLAADNGLQIDVEAAMLMAGHCNGTPGNALALLKRIKRHYRSVISDSSIGLEAAKHLLDYLGYNRAEDSTVVLADRLRSMSALDFERFVSDLFKRSGHSTELTPGSGDHGVDIRIYKSGQLGAIQCKKWLDPVGEPVLRDFLGSMVGAGATIGYVATTSSFTEQAKAFAHRHSIKLLDLESLIQMASVESPQSSPTTLF